MKFLLDVNALLALGFDRHEHHVRVAEWIRSLAGDGVSEFATCSITELGFVRVLAQVPAYGFSVSQACDLLARLRSSRRVSLAFLPDDQDLSRLPAWAKTARQTTDGHLMQLARAHGANLATLDARIPGAFLIPAD
jgi:toxin-antitoxin system PIN domain toxin